MFGRNDCRSITVERVPARATGVRSEAGVDEPAFTSLPTATEARGATNP